MKLHIFTAEWFDHGWWSRREVEMIAANEQEVRDWVDRQCRFESRYAPYRGSTEPKRDTLKITHYKEIEVPYVIHERNR